MKKISTAYYKTQPEIKEIKRDSKSDLFKIRTMLGLPDLKDTERNAVYMHNAKVENEVNYISRKMGSAEKPDEENRTREFYMVGPESQFGF
jgi:hypothetical protein